MKKMKKRIKKAAAVALMALLLVFLMTGCLPGLKEYSEEAPAGFLNGVWHGWLAPVSLILEATGCGAHLFAENTTGFSYELGFYMAVISGFGGLALSRKRKKKKDKH